MIAYIRFKDGEIRKCYGTIKGGIPNETPGKAVPWVDETEIIAHCERNELKLLSIEVVK
jgi:hypothetical protein